MSYCIVSYLCGYYRHYYPEEFVAAYLMNAANDDDISTGKEFARQSNITIGSPRFRQDNRTYYINKNEHSISDALSSIKGVGVKDAEALCGLSDGMYFYFADILYDMMNTTGALNQAVVKTLIMCNYFEEFGKRAKLLRVFDEFYNGKNKITKTLSVATQNTRMIAIREMELATENTDIPMYDVFRFEVDHFSSPVSTFKDKRGMFVILDIDEKYSPKLRLYNISSGTIGTMKMLKNLYKRCNLSKGAIIEITGWQKKPVFRYSDGKQIPTNETELWLTSLRTVA